MKNVTLYILLLHIVTSSLTGQTLDGDTRQPVRLKDGTSVILCRATDDPTAYYYLPKDLALSRREGIPEISLMIYTDENKEITGGILHVLLTWGLTENQEKELQQHITESDSVGILHGAADITLKSGILEFDQKNVFAKGLERSSSQEIKIATLPNHKTAASFDLSALMARFLADELQTVNQSKNITMKTGYSYSISASKGAFTSAVQADDEMRIPLSTWVKTLKNYRLVKRIMI